MAKEKITQNLKNLKGEPRAKITIWIYDNGDYTMRHRNLNFFSSHKVIGLFECIKYHFIRETEEPTLTIHNN